MPAHIVSIGFLVQARHIGIATLMAVVTTKIANITNISSPFGQNPDIICVILGSLNKYLFHKNLVTNTVPTILSKNVIIIDIQLSIAYTKNIFFELPPKLLIIPICFLLELTEVAAKYAIIAIENAASIKLKYSLCC